MYVLVRFAPSGRSVRVARGATLLQAIERAGLPAASACRAGGLCGRCGVHVLAGGGLAPETEEETETKRRNRVDPQLRLACRAIPQSDLEVTAPYW